MQVTIDLFIFSRNCLVQTGLIDWNMFCVIRFGSWTANTTVLSILKMLTDKNYRQAIVSRIKDNVVRISGFRVCRMERKV